MWKLKGVLTDTVDFVTINVPVKTKHKITLSSVLPAALFCAGKSLAYYPSCFHLGPPLRPHDFYIILSY